MAGAKSGVHVVQLKQISVPKLLLHGTKFLMWNDNSQLCTPVTAQVNESGTFIFWRDMNKEVDFLDVHLIRDTRTGKYARLPKDSKIRDSLQIGQKDVSTEDRTVSVCYGTDMVNIEWINLVCSDKETATIWTNELLAYSVNLLSANRNCLSFFENWFSQIVNVTGHDNKIPVKSIIKHVASNKEDRKKVDQALTSAGMMNGKVNFIDPEQITFDQFFTFYYHLIRRSEIDAIFEEMGAKKQPYLTVEQFQNFLNCHQRDPRLNEILYPLTSSKQAEELMKLYETNSSMSGKGHISLEGFMRFLMSEDNNAISAEKLDFSEDMKQPLAHYFINSSHNTYLTGHQFTSKSSVEIYHQVLLSGCRCIELDCWDGKGQDEEPIVTHGFTMCTEILFKDVIEAVVESAFKTSVYPVILSFENHCGPRQQAKMANYCRSIFGDMLLEVPLELHPLKPGVPLPSPDDLKWKIIVKNKKANVYLGAASAKSTSSKISKTNSVGRKKSAATSDVEVVSAITEEHEDKEKWGDGDALQSHSNRAIYGLQQKGNIADHDSPGLSSSSDQVIQKGDSFSSDVDKDVDGMDMSVSLPDNDNCEDSESEDDDVNKVDISEEEVKQRQKMKQDKGTAAQEAEAAMELSALVNYIQPVHFHSFESSENKKKSYEISSFVETQATALLKEQPVEFVNYNKRQLSRIYPRGTRVDSSNFLPQVYWNAGCQLVAMNFQTLDLAMHINLGIFEYNGRSGFILKPDFMRRLDRHFDPFAESTVDGIVAGQLSIKVLSGQFLSEKRVGTYVEVDMYGLPTDTVRKKFRTKSIPNNGLNPVYDEEPFIFKKIVLPNLAIIRLAVYEETGKFIGHRFMPVEGLRPGYRHIPLRNECNQPLQLQTIFVHILIKDYVPDQLAAYADALLNPIAYISQLDRHTQQLEILTEDFETDFFEGMDNSDGVMPLDNSGVEPYPLPQTAVRNVGEMMQQHNSVNTHARQVDVIPQAESNGSSQNHKLNRMASSPQMMFTKQESALSLYRPGSSRSGGKLKRMPSSNMLLDSGLERYVDKSKLNDSSLLSITSLVELKEDKVYQKVIFKRDKELDGLGRKHEKHCAMMEELHQSQLDKLIGSQTRARISMEKSHTKLLRKASKNRGNVEVMQQRFKLELQELLVLQDGQHQEMKYRHAERLMHICQDHHKAEVDIFKRFHEEIYDALGKLVTDNHNTHLKTLEDIHSDEKVELKQAMDVFIGEHMKQLAKMHKDKKELSRVKREAQTKHVSAVVVERQKLIDLLSKRQGELQESFDAMHSAMEIERDDTIKVYDIDLQEECQKIQVNFQAEVAALNYSVVKQGKNDDQSDGFTIVGPVTLPVDLSDNCVPCTSSDVGLYVSIVKVKGNSSPSRSSDSSFSITGDIRINSKEDLTSM